MNVSRLLERAAEQLRRRALDDADATLDRALAQSPNDPVAHNLRGLVAMERRDYPAAIAAYQHAMRLRSPFPEAMLNLSVACNRTGEHELAIQLCSLVLRIAPGNPLALVNLGMAYKGLRRHADALTAFERAGDHPMARFNAGHTLLLMGDLERGLPLFESRRGVLRIGAGLAGKPWNGTPAPQATLLVIPEQGLGDFLLNARFLPRLADAFARVVVQAPPPLARLAAALDPRLEVVTELGGARWDLWVPVMSLPLLCGVRSRADLPLEPWVRADVPPRAADARPRVGLNWAGNPSYAYDFVRSAPLATFAPLVAAHPEVEWVSLHRGVREGEAAEYGLPRPLADAADFLDTARAVAGCDLVLSTETAIPNLSGAMGVPTGVLAVPDWDWRWDGWYPRVTVCAQERGGDWSGAIAKASALVRELTAARSAQAA
ncbi:MAG: tetratricopeptide repeat protein [Candidatus Eisenbacteria bacterium]